MSKPKKPQAKASYQCCRCSRRVRLTIAASAPDSRMAECQLCGIYKHVRVPDGLPPKRHELMPGQRWGGHRS